VGFRYDRRVALDADR